MACETATWDVAVSESVHVNLDDVGDRSAAQAASGDETGTAMTADDVPTWQVDNLNVSFPTDLARLGSFQPPVLHLDVPRQSLHISTH